jgi:hypothetical protein
VRHERLKIQRPMDSALSPADAAHGPSCNRGSATITFKDWTASKLRLGRGLGSALASKGHSMKELDEEALAAASPDARAVALAIMTHHNFLAKNLGNLKVFLEAQQEWQVRAARGTAQQQLDVNQRALQAAQSATTAARTSAITAIILAGLTLVQVGFYTWDRGKPTTVIIKEPVTVQQTPYLPSPFP